MASDVDVTSYGSVTVNDVELDYSDFGEGEDTLVLLPALTLNRYMQVPLARALALRDIRTICLEHLGRRTDGKPHRPSHYSGEKLGAQVLDVLDELGIERAVIGGTSIGAAVSLEAALRAPDRVSGLLLEGPFLDGGVAAASLVWSAVLATFTLGRPALAAGRLLARALPRDLSDQLDLLREWVSQDPARTTAYLQGLTYSRIGPPRELRRTIETPALVVGVPVDPLHPLSDAQGLAEDMPNARLIRTSSLAGLRLRPERLAGEIARFIGDCRRRGEATPPRKLAAV